MDPRALPKFWNPLPSYLKILLLLWLLSPFAALLMLEEGNFIAFFPAMIVHELGHSVFSFLADIPAVSFFFASFSFANEPVRSMALVLGAVEIVVIWDCFRRRRLLLAGLTAAILLLNLFFLVVPRLAVPFLIFGGVAGEFVLPVLYLCIVLEIPRFRQVKGLAAFGLGSFVFWRAAFSWTFAWLGLRSIPYPRDSSGGIALFADPFAIAEGAPVGDIDKLVRTYGWPEPGIVQTYAVLGLFCILAFCGLWAYALVGVPDRLRRSEL